MAEADAKTQESVTRQRVRVTTTKDNLAAFMTLTRPEPHEADISVEEVAAALEKAGVVFGVDHVAIEKVLAEKLFATPTQVAKGEPAQRGNDAAVEYLFDTEHEIRPREDKDGRIDYRDMNFIQNVTKGSVLARKTPPTTGVPGKGVSGKEIPSARGRDFPFKYGENTRESADGLEQVASVDGAIVFSHGYIAVKDVAIISGDVDFSVGNIDSVGSVRVTGDVRAGFTVKAGGNIEILGSIENCNIEANGDVVVKGGCRSGDEGYIKAGGNVIIKYAVGQLIEAGRDVVVGGELINCKVTARERVWVKGRRGKIMGGEVNAGKEIRATTLGSDAGTLTVVAVAYEEELMTNYRKTLREIRRLETDGVRVKESLVALYKLQMDGKLAPGREAALKKLEDFQKSLPGALEGLNKTKSRLEEKMSEFRDARIVAEGAVYPGVRVHFGIIYRDISEEIKTRKLLLEGSQIVLAEWRPGED